MPDIKTIAENADMIVDGYAFTKCEIGYRVINLNAPDSAAVLSNEGEPLEMTMDDIEIKIVKNIFQKDRHYMED